MVVRYFVHAKHVLHFRDKVILPFCQSALRIFTCALLAWRITDCC